MIQTLYPQGLSSRASFGILLLRIVTGLAFVAHGLPKIAQASSWMGPHAFAPPWLQAVVALVEVFGGIALVIGFLTPLVAILIIADMATAILTVHIPSGGHWVGGRGSFEVPLFYLVMMLALLLTGPGQYSIDALIAKRLPSRQIGTRTP